LFGLYKRFVCLFGECVLVNTIHGMQHPLYCTPSPRCIVQSIFCALSGFPPPPLFSLFDIQRRTVGALARSARDHTRHRNHGRVPVTRRGRGGGPVADCCGGLSFKQCPMLNFFLTKLKKWLGETKKLKIDPNHGRVHLSRGGGPAANYCGGLAFKKCSMLNFF